MRTRTRLFAALLAGLAACGAPGGDGGDDGGAIPPPVPESDDMSTPPEEDAVTHAHTNRLAKESSPYLLQHQHNPVDWYPWGEEAFERARAEDKAIFLSIGYSTCHWCHVMERESFENEDIAAVMNQYFVCVKVDREERPDVDAIYMKAVQAISSGRGGWPLSAWITADGRPFFGGTYFPPEDRYGRPGFKTILERVATLWREQRPELLAQADRLTDALREKNTTGEKADIGPATLDTVVSQFGAANDAAKGGFGPPPKFPRAFSHSLLLRLATRDRAEQIHGWVTNALDHMQRGGIYDHLGGGFHRYSTDREWLVPHFEKMLYDQALLARAYLEARIVTGDDQYEHTARAVFEYVRRDLQDPGGAFHSAEDADSEGVEGKYYVWTPAEIEAVIGADDAALIGEIYRAKPDGNFRDEATHEPSGVNILHLEIPLAEHAQKNDEDEEAFRLRIAALRQRLLDTRVKRIHPHLDDKVLTDWNGLMIGSLAYGGATLDDASYLAAARTAADFLLTTMWNDGDLLHRYRKGDAGIPGFLEDYAFLAHGLIELHQATQEVRWLESARDITKAMVTRFHDKDAGGFLLASSDGERLVSQTKELYDGAIPSGNSVASYVLLRLGRLTGDAEMEQLGRDTLATWSGTIAQYPMGYPFALMALDFDVGPSREIVIAGDPADARTQALLREVHSRFLPRTVVLLNPPGPAGDAVRKLAPYCAEQGPVDGAPAAYVCTNYTCQAPVTSPEELAKLLN